jgi:hypothetical protein
VTTTPDPDDLAFLTHEYGYSRQVLGRDHATTMRWLREGFPHLWATPTAQQFAAALDDPHEQARLLAAWRLP